ncbi:MAG: ribosome maturation factor RimM [Campylobacterota bacterium]|nr:ribosome maturation factor RimM [Campylobacterota bacterium]
MSRLVIKKELLQIATLGRSVGIFGEMKLHIKSDFPEQFVVGAKFTTQKGITLTIKSINIKKGTVSFEGYNSLDDAKKLTNSHLFTTYEQTRKNCHLDDGEFFWFDVVGCDVYENELYLGRVQEVERIGINEYLNIKTADELVEKKHSKIFLIPYIDKFVKSTNIEEKRIEVIDGFDLLEAS